MSDTLLIILMSIGFVGLFVLGMSLTLIIKGHNIKSEISENEHMRERGLKCAVQQMREEESDLKGNKRSFTDCPSTGCASCATGTENQCG